MITEHNILLNGDAMVLLKSIPLSSVDALITDPPYSSGGLHAGSRRRDTRDKYLTVSPMAAEYAKHSFDGDNLDQRAWTSWMAEWLSLARSCTKRGGIAAIFVDWRQIGALCDAIQWAGWTWRGIIAWDKKNARPQLGRPRQQCEFILWASNGALSAERNAPILPGIFTEPVPSTKNRLHQTEKPETLMRNLVHICEKGGVILDPFAGSGTTLVAAALEGFKYIGIEKDEHYYQTAQKRIMDMRANTKI